MPKPGEVYVGIGYRMVIVATEPVGGYGLKDMVFVATPKPRSRTNKWCLGYVHRDQFGKNGRGWAKLRRVRREPTDFGSPGVELDEQGRRRLRLLREKGVKVYG